MENRYKIRVLYILIIVCSIPIISWVNCNNQNNDFDNDKNKYIHDLDSQIKLSNNPPNNNYFKYYKEITINHLKVSDDLTNFSLLVSIFDEDLHDDVQYDGDDIAFAIDNEWLDHEIELFHQSYSSTHAQLVAWVRIPSLSSTIDTKIYMYYGNSTMGSQQNPSGVWSSNYKGVWHLNTTLLDSTSNDNDGTNYEADDGSAYIANGRDYDGSNDYSNMGSDSSIDNIFNGGATISAWIKPEGWGGGQYGRVLAKSSVTAGTDGWVMCVDGEADSVDHHLLFYRGFDKNPYRGLWYTPADSISLNQWQYVVVTYDDGSDTNVPSIYINAGASRSLTPEPSPSGDAVDDSSQELYIGNYGGVLKDRAFDGIIDEVRISSGIKSSDWIQTEYNNQYDPNSFYTVSSSFEIDKVPPDITINLPTNNTLFGSIAPNFIVEIDDNNSISSRWYRLLNGTATTINTTFTSNGSINQTRWNEMGNGTITIQFFANDSSGNIGFSEVVVRKDIIFPSVVIIAPNNFDLFGSTAPDYNVEIWDHNGVDYRWYTLNNGLETYFNDNGTISQSAWSLCGNGTVSIKFYANDSLGNEGFSEVIVRKEIESPTITIKSPHDLDLFGSTAPAFNVEIWDSNGVDTMWYTLNNGIDIPFTENGTISPSAWSLCGNGTVSIKFYANNTLGNTDFSEVIVRKDMIDPVITINTPDPDDLFGSTAPSFTVIITDPNGIDTRWYTIDGGITNTTFTSNGIINQSLWESRVNGTVTIGFYANDSLGNVGYEEVIVRKDIEPPSIQINSPNPYELFGVSAPSFNVEIIDSSGINTRWYTIDGGVTNITFTSNDTINQGLWSFEENGTVTIKFYATDSLGNEGSSNVTVRKDMDPPLIQINSPHDDELFNEIAPNFNVEIGDSNGVDTMWYTLNNGIDIPFTGNGTISQSDWFICDYGSISIKFYANDSLGNEDFSEVIVQKELSPPSIIINNPISDQLFGVIAPIYNVEITDFNGIDTMWYSLDGGLTNIIFTTNSSINQTIWDTFGDGNITIRFYANNSIGIIGFSEVSIVKDIYAPMITINSPNNNSYCNKAPIINIDAYDINFDKLWCKIGSSNISLINNADFELNSSIWDSLPEGSFQIFIYANDTIGHLNDTIVLMLCKDTISPNAPILLNFPTGEVSLPIIFDWEDGTDASGIDHYRLIIDNEEDPFASPGFIFEINITNIGSESSYYELFEYLIPSNYYFFIYQIDEAGNQGSAAYDTFTIKSTSAPVTQFPWWIILVIAVPLGLALVIVGLKKSKKKEIQVVIIDKELDKLKENRVILDAEAKSAEKSYNYLKAADNYEDCAKISYQLYNEGDKIEEYKYKEYKRLEMEARSNAESIPLRNDCINNLLTRFFDENGIKYYSNPQIYPENQGMINGLILNDNNFLQNRFTNLDDSPDLAEELHTDPANLENVNAIQLLYVIDLSVDAIIDYCQKFQNPNMILYIVGIEWPAYNYEEKINLPKDKTIKYPENIKIFDLNLFFRIFLIDDQYKAKLNNIIDLKSDIKALEELFETSKIHLHNSQELKDELKQKGWFFLI